MIKILTSRNTGLARTLWAAAHETPELKMCPTPALDCMHQYRRLLFKMREVLYIVLKVKY